MTHIWPISARKDKGAAYMIEHDHCYAQRSKDECVFVCAICSETFETKETLKEHAELHKDSEDNADNGDIKFDIKIEDKQDEQLKKTSNKIKQIKKLNTEEKYKCDLCDKRFFKAVALKQHKFKIHEKKKHENKLNKVYKCSKCFKSFSTSSQLKKHNVFVHNAFHLHMRKFKCEICDASFPRKVLLSQHAKTHKGILKYKCEVCHRGFGGLSAFTQHQVTAHGKEIKRRPKKEATFQCVKCSRYFVSEPGLAFHKLKMHKEKKKIIMTESAFKCLKCSKYCKSEVGLAFHNVRVHKDKYKCSLCAETFVVKMDYQSHLRTHKDDLFENECDLCHKRFEKAQGLLSHKKHKHGMQITSMSLQCFHCGMIFQNHRQLKCHEESAHSVDFQCIECGKMFKMGEHLKRHVKNIHGVRDKICLECGATFTTDYTLNRHQKSHTKKFVCSSCGRGFAHNSDLKEHEWSHTNKKDLTCAICNKVYTPKYFKRHMGTHAGKAYECRHCGKKLGTPWALKYHENVKKCGQ